MKPIHNLADHIQKMQNGDRRALARAITHVENESPLANDILNRLYPQTGKAQIIGVTGAPGTGKSTFVNALTLHIRTLGKSVAIVAVDPSSPFSHGAVLGDRIRMQALSGDAGVYIRSMASRGSLGGLARTTLDVVRVLDAVGFDVILIETVGAGQSEVAIASAAHTTIVIEAPGLGDDIQATKAGILEIADILVVNKADHPAAYKTEQVLKTMLDLGHRMQAVAHHGIHLLPAQPDQEPEIDLWRVPVLKTIASDGTGIDAVYQAIEAHHQHRAENATTQHTHQLEAELATRLQEALLSDFLQRIPAQQIQQVIDAMQQRQLSPQDATISLLADYQNAQI